LAFLDTTSHSTGGIIPWCAAITSAFYIYIYMADIRSLQCSLR
jgi:hypothetical protein